jgi:hypothetical protein
MAKVISRIPGASAQILPYDIKSRITQVTRAQRDSIGPEALRVAAEQSPNGNGAVPMVDPAPQVVE